MMKKGMPMRGERTAKHVAKEKKAMTAAGSKQTKSMAGAMPPMYGGKVAMKKGKK